MCKDDFKNCVAGCKHFSGGEVKHHSSCPNYPESFSEMYDKLSIHNASQQRELLKAFYAYIDDKWALGMLTDKVDEVIEGFEKSL